MIPPPPPTPAVPSTGGGSPSSATQVRNTEAVASMQLGQALNSRWGSKGSGYSWVTCSYPEPHSHLYEIELNEPTPGVLETGEVPVFSPTSLLNPDSFPRNSTHGSWP